jgi:hypothetical protein
MSVVKVTKWKMDYYKNASGDGGAMHKAIQNKKQDEIIILSHTKKDGRMWGSCSPDKYINLLEKNKGLYEVITSFPHKVYFDIDKESRQEESYLTSVKEKISTYFPDCKFAVSGSYTEKKTSFHIVLENYLISNEDERTQMKILVKNICETDDDGFDWKVYTKNRNMKSINQSKDDKRIQSIIENEDYKSHCITCFFENSYAFPVFPSIEKEVAIETSKKPIDLGQLPKMNLKVPTHIDDIDECSNKTLLELLPVNKKFYHDYTHRVARFCFYNELSFDDFYSWIMNKHEHSNAIKKKWMGHWSKLSNFPSVSRKQIITLLSSFYPLIKKDRNLRRFKETFIFENENIQKIETITPSCFTILKKYILFNTGMGSGKTAQTSDYINDNLGSSLLWIALNRALSSNTLHRFEEKKIEVTDYMKISTNSKKLGELNDYDKLMCCLNSLHYISRSYDIVVIDEIETILDIFGGDFLNKQKKKKEIWNTFCNILKNAKKVICLDAFISTKTLNFLKSMGDYEDNSIIYERLYEPQTRTIKYIEDYENVTADIITKLRNNQKVWIFYPYKNQVGDYQSQETLTEVISKATGKNGVFYNADIDDDRKKDLKNVNKSWSKYDFVITNNIVTCGVNYEKEDYDYKYLFVAKHNTPRQIIQVSYRIRSLSTGIIKVHFMGKMKQPACWDNDCSSINCPNYTHLYNDLLIEKSAPLRKSFEHFCIKAHYKQECETLKTNEKLNSEIKALFEECQISHSYETIDEIDNVEAQNIQYRLFGNMATMHEKFQLKKYFFKTDFNNDCDEAMLGRIWDENYLFFFEKMKVILSDENHLFHKIAKFNGIDFFPTNFKKIKLNDEITEQIFKEFSFKYVTKKSSSITILHEIYTTYFGHIYMTDYKKNKHVTYTLYDYVLEYLEFARENMYIKKPSKCLITADALH